MDMLLFQATQTDETFSLYNNLNPDIFNVCFLIYFFISAARALFIIAKFFASIYTSDDCNTFFSTALHVLFTTCVLFLLQDVWEVAFYFLLWLHLIVEPFQTALHFLKALVSRVICIYEKFFETLDLTEQNIGFGGKCFFGVLFTGFILSCAVATPFAIACFGMFRLLQFIQPVCLILLQGTIAFIKIHARIFEGTVWILFGVECIPLFHDIQNDSSLAKKAEKLSIPRKLSVSISESISSGSVASLEDESENLVDDSTQSPPRRKSVKELIAFHKDMISRVN